MWSWLAAKKRPMGAVAEAVVKDVAVEKAVVVAEDAVAVAAAAGVVETTAMVETSLPTWWILWRTRRPRQAKQK